MKAFEAEQWMTRYEREARWNLADTSLPSFRLQQLQEQLGDIVLDYGWIDGSRELLEAVSALYEERDREILPTLGASCANALVMDHLLEPGDEVIVFHPGYLQFDELARRNQAEVRIVETDENGRFDEDELLASLGERTRLIAFASPNNPDGRVFSDEQLAFLLHLAEERNIHVLCDEVYRLREPSLGDMSPAVITTGSLSKIYGGAGLRLGWVRAGSDLIQALRLDKDYAHISTGPLSDRLASLILQRKEEVLDGARSHLETNRNLLKRMLERRGDTRTVVPDHGNCAFLALKTEDDETFCRRMALEEQVLLVPGSYFGKKGYARLGLGTRPDLFEESLERFLEAEGRITTQAVLEF